MLDLKVRTLYRLTGPYDLGMSWVVQHQAPVEWVCELPESRVSQESQVFFMPSLPSSFSLKLYPQAVLKLVSPIPLRLLFLGIPGITQQERTSWPGFTWDCRGINGIAQLDSRPDSIPCVGRPTVLMFRDVEHLTDPTVELPESQSV